MEKNLFDFNHYIPYLNFQFSRPGQRGARTRLGLHIQVQPTYVSQILQEKAHLSLEQAERTSQFLQHTDQETHYFLLLVQKDRAATKSLRNYFQNQIDMILKSRLVVAERLERVEAISSEDRGWYYSSWLHSAIHMGVTISKLQKPFDIAKAFSIPESKCLEILERLTNMGLLQKIGVTYQVSHRHVRLGRDNDDIMKHHTNWRLQAVQSLEFETLQDLHYSAVITLSEKDALIIKDIFLDAVKRAQAIIRDSPEEKLCVLNVDLFHLLKVPIP